MSLRNRNVATLEGFVGDNYFDLVTDVSETWERIKQSPHYKEDFGVALFTRMFEAAPDMWVHFPWGLEGHNHHLLESPHLAAVARQFTKMLDRAIEMLGPDLQLVENQLQWLGVSHAYLGLTPVHYTLIGQALMATLESKLGAGSGHPRKFTRRHKDSWNTIYSFISTSMIQGAFLDLKRVSSVSKIGTH
ncbi:Involved in oxygen transport in the brain. Hexacoordinate globin [Seminavis robusta]|uniref:Involved in oxygen transport in the brain. Hexacoordinate globin n=1 Tax=Seminavis robusta TaxID=568900 RepID=A0A9N8HQS0_9STRA|nr:Involved in oxygen transport in the brain. Hexacoordinate globin [Seminavis robusta]|eukprot:Sro1320_g262370.1 Involved in oxygen transport in the brain. Hexacoordinate globin (190) ;mRNA; f:14199-14962